jgi:hypothetical protein
MSDRSDTLVKLKIGSLEIIPTDCGGGDNPRRVAKHGAIGMDGEWTEDLGEDARTDNFTATISESDWLKLDRIKRAGLVVDIVHPLFGSYRGRVISCPYKANALDMVDVTITTIEEGEHRQYSILPSLGQAIAAARKSYEDVGMSGWIIETELGDDFAGWPTDAVSGLASFGAFLSDLESGIEKTWQEAGAAYDAVSTMADIVVDTVDAITDLPSDLIEQVSTLTDSVYDLVSSAREIVDAIGSDVADTWRRVSSAAERTIDGVLLEYLGEATDETLALLLGANPELIDLVILPGGTEIKIPVIA